jgi:hypothetical protein
MSSNESGLVNELRGRSMDLESELVDQKANAKAASRGAAVNLSAVTSQIAGAQEIIRGYETAMHGQSAEIGELLASLKEVRQQAEEALAPKDAQATAAVQADAVKQKQDDAGKAPEKEEPFAFFFEDEILRELKKQNKDMKQMLEEAGHALASALKDLDLRDAEITKLKEDLDFVENNLQDAVDLEDRLQKERDQAVKDEARQAKHSEHLTLQLQVSETENRDLREQLDQMVRARDAQLGLEDNLRASLKASEGREFQIRREFDAATTLIASLLRRNQP